MIHALSTRCPDCKIAGRESTLRLYRNKSDGSRFIRCSQWRETDCDFRQDYLPAMQNLCETLRTVCDAKRDLELQIHTWHSARVQEESEAR